MYEVWGVDPGLVHTGVVHLSFDTEERTFSIETQVFPGFTNAQGKQEIPVDDIITHINLVNMTRATVFIEAYRPRSNFDSDPEMGRAVNALKAGIRSARTLLNTGSVSCITPKMMQLLNLWTFGTRTHHQDLRSAARIALFGMVKDDYTNTILAQVVEDHLAGRSWTEK